jgi:hypothetical protein
VISPRTIILPVKVEFSRLISSGFGFGFSFTPEHKKNKVIESEEVGILCAQGIMQTKRN